MKHIISVLDLIGDQARGHHADQKMWEEKIGDAINYLILLEALVTEYPHERLGCGGDAGEAGF
jgi:hypothetical protein